MAAPLRVIAKRREAITELPLYYSGHLQKKYTGEREFKRFFGELRGSTIFLYTEEKHEMYCERLELRGLKNMIADSTYAKRSPTVYTLTLLNEEVQLKIENPDTGEEWKGYIMTVATFEVPPRLQLLPGQILKLQEVLDLERQRTAPSPNPQPWGPTTPTLPNEYNDSISLPSCFFPVSRKEAENMLEEKQECGSIILRPANDSTNYAITMRQSYPSGPVLKNYRVVSSDSGFVIELEEPVTLPTLSDVVDHFLEKTDNQLRPFSNALPYDTRIELPPRPAIIKPLPHARVAPMIRTQLSPSNTPQQDNKYLVVDDTTPGLHEELEKAVKKRREFIYANQGKK